MRTISLCPKQFRWYGVVLNCISLGAKQGIRDLPGVVALSNPGSQGVDWRLAYEELTYITQEARATVPVPEQLSFEGMELRIFLYSYIYDIENEKVSMI